MIPVRRFRPGKDAIGIISPSDSIADFPRRTARAIAHLQKATGSEVRFGANARGRYGRLSGDAAARASDLNNMLRDEEIGLIITSTGGYNSLEVALETDLRLLSEYPKPIVGMSDATALLLDLHRRTGRVCFHGPSLLQNFGQAAAPDWQVAELLACVAGPTKGRSLPDPPGISTIFQFWDRDDEEQPQLVSVAPRRAWGQRPAEGPLVGGNLDTLVALAAARRVPDTKGALVFVEAAFGVIEKVQRDLIVLNEANLFAHAAGLIVGLPYCVANGERIFQLTEELAAIHRLPLIQGMSLGHTSPISVLPIGASARLDPHEASVALLEEVTVDNPF